MKNRVQELREAKGWSREKLAVLADVSGRTIMNVELGRNVRMSTLQAIAKALKVDVLEVLGGEREAS